MPRKKRTRRVMVILLIVSGLYLVCVVFLTVAQRRMMYFPCKTSRAELERDAAKGGFRPWRDGEGHVIGWYRAAQDRRQKCVLVLHGNAGCAPDRFHYADAFQAIEPMDFYILEYPGYGSRPGAPSQKAILRAVDEALRNMPCDCSVFVMAESLGTGVGTYLAGKHPDRIRGVLLIAPYSNMGAVAKRHLPLFPVRWMLRDKYPASEWLSAYGGPVAVLLAGRDEVIPTDLGRALFDSYTGPKKLWLEPELGHNDLHMPRDGTWKEVIEFWNSTAPEPR